jgi:hypothetical protein
MRSPEYVYSQEFYFWLYLSSTIRILCAGLYIDISGKGPNLGQYNTYCAACR